MDLREFVHHYDGFFGSPSKCHVRILNDKSKPLIVMCSQGKNHGTSITNNAENIHSELINILKKENKNIFEEFRYYWNKNKGSKIIFDVSEKCSNKTFFSIAMQCIAFLLDKKENYEENNNKIENLIWIEHYSASASITGTPIYFYTKFDKSTGDPVWHPVSLEFLSQKTGYSNGLLTVPCEVVDSI